MGVGGGSRWWEGGISSRRFIAENTTLPTSLTRAFLGDGMHYRRNKAKKSADLDNIKAQLVFHLLTLGNHLMSPDLSNLTCLAFLTGLLWGSNSWHVSKHFESHTI